MPLQNDEEFVERIYFDGQIIRWAYLDDELVYGLFDIKYASPVMPSSYPTHFVWGKGTSLPDPGTMNSLGYGGDGYRINHFSGWYAENNFQTKIESISKDIKDDSVLYAKWRRRNFHFKRIVMGTLPYLTPHSSLDDLPKEFYTLASYGGLAQASDLGSEPPWTGAIVPDCQGYCYGRWLELGASNKDCIDVGLHNSASYSVRMNLRSGGDETTLPEVGAVLLFTEAKPGESGKTYVYNHQAFVERIENGKMTISQSNYYRTGSDDWKFNTRTIGYSVTEIDAWGRGVSAGPYKGWLKFPGTLKGSTPWKGSNEGDSDDPYYQVPLKIPSDLTIEKDETTVTTYESTIRYNDDLTQAGWSDWTSIGSGSSANTNWSD